MKTIIIAISFLLVAQISKAQDNKKSYFEAFKLIEIWLDAQKDFENIPGMVAMVVQDQDVLWTGAFGKSDLKQNTAMDINTICSICSITKSFTAVAIMKLVDEGKLNLDDKVEDLLPFFNVNQKFPSEKVISVRSLLAHASGLPGNTKHSYYTGPDFIFPSKEEFREVFNELETESEVGTDVNYSNIGYALLGEIVSKISGVPYEDYIKEEILNPLKMTETSMGTLASLNNQATGYTAINRDRTRNSVNVFDTKSMQPAMGLWSSINDLAKYASWQFRLHDASQSEILKPSTLQTMHSVQSKSKNGYMNWGLGFEVIEASNGDTWVSHGGTCPGFVSLLQLNLNTKIGLAIMINSNRAQTFKYLNGIKQILDKVDEVKKFDIPNVNLNDYVGFYNMNPWNSEVYISTWNDLLVVLQLPENSPKRGMRFFKHIEGDTFRVINENKELVEEFVFQRDEKGKIYGYRDGGNYKYKINR